VGDGKGGGRFSSSAFELRNSLRGKSVQELSQPLKTGLGMTSKNPVISPAYESRSKERGAMGRGPLQVM
jgi:hypothetical protein